jgi:hypothetical protein
MDPQTPAQRRLVQRLWARHDSGVVVPYVEVSAGDWKPVPRYCHANVRRWVELNAAHKAIRGWLFFAFGFEMCPQFVAHSVVQRSDGLLMDITPANVSSRMYPFIKHQGDADEFDRLIEQWNVVALNYRG